MADPFETLGLTRDADEDEIRAAHRELARRWHPDRFMPGPERIWAEDRMEKINTAYMACLDVCKKKRPGGMEDVRRLIDKGEFAKARDELMRRSERNAEWDHLFGRAMLGLGKSDKAILYLETACRQSPDNREYREVLEKAKPPRGERLPVWKRLLKAGREKN